MAISTENRSQRAAFTGTFDPITLGHLDLVKRASDLFTEVVVGVGINPEKRSLFSPDERAALVKETVQEFSNVTVMLFEGLTVKFVKSLGSNLIIRGVRSSMDMDYEFTMARTNRTLEPGIETVFLAASEAFSHLSSTLIRQLASEATPEQLAQFVPTAVIQPLLDKVNGSQ